MFSASVSTAHWMLINPVFVSIYTCVAHTHPCCKGTKGYRATSEASLTFPIQLVHLVRKASFRQPLPRHLHRDTIYYVYLFRCSHIEQEDLISTLELSTCLAP